MNDLIKALSVLTNAVAEIEVIAKSAAEVEQVAVQQTERVGDLEVRTTIYEDGRKSLEDYMAEGRAARFKMGGIPNPYPPTSGAWALWEQGWDIADTELKARILSKDISSLLPPAVTSAPNPAIVIKARADLGFYGLGKLAGTQGRNRHDNPHFGGEGIEWHRGWDDADKPRGHGPEWEGRKAYDEGLARDGNPFGHLTVAWSQWADGWQLRQKEETANPAPDDVSPPKPAARWGDLTGSQKSYIITAAHAYVTPSSAQAQEIASEMFYAVQDVLFGEVER